MIKSNKNWQKLAKFTKELDKRVDSVKRQTVMKISQKALAGIQKKAPTNDSQLGNYAANLEVKEIDGHIAYGILHSGKPEKTTELDSKRVLLYIKPINPEKENRTNLVYRVMQKYEPFVVGMWPPGIPKNDVYIVYRPAKEGEVEQTRANNLKNLRELIAELSAIGVRVKRSDFPKVSFEAFQDVSHSVIQKEKGILTKPKPHWVPGIKAAQRSDVLAAIKADPAMLKALGDPDFKGWENFGKMPKVSENALKNIKRFQELIVG